MSASYNAYGHSVIVNPNGEILAKAGTDEEIIYADCDPQSMEDTRKSIPVTTQRRFDVYQDVASK
jgi:predicted amidohydrolase